MRQLQIARIIARTLWGFFVQDDPTRSFRNLTIKFGTTVVILPWRSSTPKQKTILTYSNSGRGTNPLDGMYIRVGGHLYDPQKNNWGPQVGFAFQPSKYEGRLVMRGGFGINYNQNEIADHIRRAAVSSPYCGGGQLAVSLPLHQQHNLRRHRESSTKQLTMFTPSLDTLPTRMRSHNSDRTICL